MIVSVVSSADQELIKNELFPFSKNDNIENIPIYSKQISLHKENIDIEKQGG